MGADREGARPRQLTGPSVDIPLFQEPMRRGVIMDPSSCSGLADHPAHQPAARPAPPGQAESFKLPLIGNGEGDVSRVRVCALPCILDTPVRPDNRT